MWAADRPSHFATHPLDDRPWGSILAVFPHLVQYHHYRHCPTVDRHGADLGSFGPGNLAG